MGHLLGARSPPLLTKPEDEIFLAPPSLAPESLGLLPFSVLSRGQQLNNRSSRRLWVSDYLQSVGRATDR